LSESENDDLKEKQEKKPSFIYKNDSTEIAPQSVLTPSVQIPSEKESGSSSDASSEKPSTAKPTRGDQGQEDEQPKQEPQRIHIEPAEPELKLEVKP
jgi:hypothetical protein